MIDVAFFIRPGDGSVSGDCWNENEMVILSAQTFELFYEGRITRIPIGVKQIHFVFYACLSGVLKDAANRGDSDATSEKYRGLGRVFM